MNEWVLIEEGTLLPGDFFDVENYEEREAAKAGWINRKKYIIDILGKEDIQKNSFNEYIGISCLTKSVIRQIIFGDHGYTRIRYRIRTDRDKPFNSSMNLIARLYGTS